MKTCKNCGLKIAWEGMMVEVEGGFICHPDCRGGSGTVVTTAPQGPRPASKAEKIEK